MQFLTNRNTARKQPQRAATVPPHNFYNTSLNVQSSVRLSPTTTTNRTCIVILSSSIITVTKRDARTHSASNSINTFLNSQSTLRFKKVCLFNKPRTSAGEVPLT